MIIDCHGHYTTSPPEHEAWRAAQVQAVQEGAPVPPRFADNARAVYGRLSAQLARQMS